MLIGSRCVSRCSRLLGSMLRPAAPSWRRQPTVTRLLRTWRVGEFAAVFLNLASHSEVRGRLGMDTVRPEVYRGEVHRNGVHTYNRVDYGADRMVTGGSTPPGATRKPVTPALMRGTVDQLSALFIMERQLASRGSCARVVAVYDGLRRYDLHFTDAVPQTIPASGGHSFAGATQVCRMRREAIAGFLDDSGRGEGAYAGTLSYARTSAGRSDRSGANGVQYRIWFGYRPSC